jgi:single-strand DNA-binding protein
MSNQNFKVMNSLRNRVQLIGHLGQDPELKSIEGGKKVARFTLATDDGYKNSEGQKVNETTWHNIVAWNGLADLIEKHLKKGRKIALEGRIVYRSYEDKKGVTKYITEIVMNDFTFLDPLKNGVKEAASKEE